MRPAVRAGRARYLVLLVVPFFCTLAYFITRPTYTWRPPAHVGPPRTRLPSTSNETADWWVEFFTRLNNTQVMASPTKIKGKARADNWRPDIDYARPDLWKLSEDDQARFRQSHASIVKQLPDFARHLPYRAGTTGVVTTAGAANFGQAVSVVLMTRQTGSHLPIEVVLDSSSEWADWVCANMMPRFNATCVYLEDMWVSLHPFVPKFRRYQWKFISIIASTFQNVLFLDADCLPVLNPDSIFEHGAEPFTSAGFITWPDFWTPSSSPLFYKIAGDIEVPPLTARTSSESGIMVYDKARHGDTLLLAAYYNYNGPRHYYDVLTQHGISGDGDKETFLQAALVLDALRRKGVYEEPTGWMKPGIGVKKGYWDVKRIPMVHGRSVKGEWNGMFMQQMDPVEDYRVVMAAIEEAKRGPEAKAEDEDKVEENNEDRPKEMPKHKPGEGTGTENKVPRRANRRRFWRWGGKDKPETSGEKAPPPTIAQVKPGPTWQEDFLTDSSFLATVGNLTLNHYHGRFMFFHHNGVKPDFTRILDKKAGIVAVNEEGKYVRMWGDPGWVIQRTGRDVEKLWWQDSIQIYCHPEMAQWAPVCAKMQEVYAQVYDTD
ncbi:mannosyltransferase [Madurella fahalii]|uniref:Mannosyltransferase n=1 Tax=Madurella fahalii TaxID=1157608 RepID=A0ABQ0GLP6_9PEZI